MELCLGPRSTAGRKLVNPLEPGLEAKLHRSRLCDVSNCSFCSPPLLASEASAQSQAVLAGLAAGSYFPCAVAGGGVGDRQPYSGCRRQERDELRGAVLFRRMLSGSGGRSARDVSAVRASARRVGDIGRKPRATPCCCSSSAPDGSTPFSSTLTLDASPTESVTFMQVPLYSAPNVPLPSGTYQLAAKSSDGSAQARRWR